MRQVIPLFSGTWYVSRGEPCVQRFCAKCYPVECSLGIAATTTTASGSGHVAAPGFVGAGMAFSLSCPFLVKGAGERGPTDTDGACVVVADQFHCPVALGGACSSPSTISVSGLEGSENMYTVQFRVRAATGEGMQCSPIPDTTKALNFPLLTPAFHGNPGP